MKNIYKTIGVGLASASFFLTGCESTSTTPSNTSIQGTVLSENYVPAKSGWNGSKSKYSFSIETERGIKLIQVSSYDFVGREKVYKESIDTLIEKGTKVEIENIMEYNLDDQVYDVYADEIKILDE